MAEYFVLVGAFASLLGGFYRELNEDPNPRKWHNWSIWCVFLGGFISLLSGVFVVRNQDQLNEENKEYLKENINLNKKFADMFSEGEEMPYLVFSDLKHPNRNCLVNYDGRYPKSDVIFEVADVDQIAKMEEEGSLNDYALKGALTRIPSVGNINLIPGVTRRLVGFPWPKDSHSFRINIFTRWNALTQYVHFYKQGEEWFVASILLDKENKIRSIKYDAGFPLDQNGSPVWPTRPVSIGQVFE